MNTKKSAPSPSGTGASKARTPAGTTGAPRRAANRATRPAAAVAAARVDPAAPAAPKVKLVRDSFTIPKAEYAVLDQLKLRAAKLARPTKKSELIRAGIKALAALGDPALLESLGKVPSLKTGRPKKVPPVKSDS